MIKKILGLLFIILLVGYFVYQDRIAEFRDRMICELGEETIFFYGDGCPHCKNVELYMDSNNIKRGFDILEMEVYNSAENRAELLKAGKCCHIEEMQLGVPLLWTGKKCLMGSEDIINYLAISY